MSPFLFIRKLLEDRLERAPRDWFRRSTGEIADGASTGRFCALLAQASRHARRDTIELTDRERVDSGKLVEGWSPERWTLLELLRVGLILSVPELREESGVTAMEEAFRYADEGELCALYRSLALLPAPERFVWRAGEGCRTNMRSVFEATALDTPYPVRQFDDVAWRQAVIKCVFIEAPLWRMWGLDQRLSEELARMALDLADERRSAGRLVQPDLWLCLGAYGGTRGRESIELELDPDNAFTRGRRAAAYALMRAGEGERLGIFLETEHDRAVVDTMQDALAGNVSQEAFRALEPNQ